MIKIIIAIAFLITSYLGLFYLNQYNGSVIISVLNYKIYTSLFFCLFTISLCVIFLLLILKLLLTIFNIPSFISEVNSKQNLYKLLYSSSLILIKNYLEAKKVISKIEYNAKSDVAVSMNVLLYYIEKDFDQKMHHLRQLLDHNDYRFFAAKHLARNLIDHGYYQRGLEYLLISYNINENDEELVEMLVDIYAKLGVWHKFKFMMKKLEEISPEKLLQIADKIASHYFNAAKSMLESGEDKEAICDLKSSLFYKPDYVEAIELLCTLNVNLNQNHNNITIIENALETCQSLELVKLYISFSGLKPQKLLSKLNRILLFPNKYDLLIHVAVILNLSEDLKQLLEEDIKQLTKNYSNKSFVKSS